MYQPNSERRVKTDGRTPIILLTIIALTCAVLHSSVYFISEQLLYYGDEMEVSVNLQWVFSDPSVNIVWQITGFLCFIIPFILLAVTVTGFFGKKPAAVLLAAAFGIMLLFYLNSSLYYALYLWKNALWSPQSGKAYSASIAVLLVRDSLMTLACGAGIIGALNEFSSKAWAIVPSAIGFAEAAVRAVEFAGSVGSMADDNRFFALLCNFSFIAAGAAFFTVILLYGIFSRAAVILTFALEEPPDQSKKAYLKELQFQVWQGIITPEEYDEQWKKLQK